MHQSHASDTGFCMTGLTRIENVRLVLSRGTDWFIIIMKSRKKKKKKKERIRQLLMFSRNERISWPNHHANPSSCTFTRFSERQNKPEKQKRHSNAPSLLNIILAFAAGLKEFTLAFILVLILYSTYRYLNGIRPSGPGAPPSSLAM